MAKAQTGASGIDMPMLPADATRYTKDLSELKEEVIRAKNGAKGPEA
jgi:hypothetical protein